MPSRTIPAGIKRQVRQECYFGCVFCGMPVFEYEHIDDWADVQEHKAETSCSCAPLISPPRRQASSTVSGYEHSAQIQSTSLAIKLRHIRVEGDRNFEIKLANLNFAWALPDDGTPYHILWVNGKTLLSVRVIEGFIVPSFVPTNRAGVPILSVRDGEIEVTTSVWDYTYEGSTITVRGALGNILLKITLSSSRLLVQRGQFFLPDRDGFDIYDGDMEAFGSTFGGRLILSGGGNIGFGNVAIAMTNPRLYQGLKPPDGTAFTI